MKIGVILPIGRMDKYGYQYNNITKLIIKRQLEFADHIIILSTSRFINKLLFNHQKIELISNKKTWFNLVNGKEIYSTEISKKRTNFGIFKLREEGYDIAIIVHINQYIPKSSEKNLRKSFQKIINKNKPYTWLYKRYLCGNLLFNADMRLPWIINLNLPLKWRIGSDSITNGDTKEFIKMQAGNFKKFNNEAIIDIPWEMTIQDGKEKYEYVIKEYRILNKTYEPNNPENLKFNERKWLKYHQHKVNLKKVSNDTPDNIGRCILKFRESNFISHIFEENYNYEPQYWNWIKIKALLRKSILKFKQKHTI